MIGAEIVALVALLIGGGMGVQALWQWSKSRAARRAHDYALDERMRTEMRAAIEAKGHAPIDEFVALWGFRLSKQERAQLDKIREDRYLAEEGS